MRINSRNKRTIKRLQKQNAALRQQNKILRNKTPSEEYTDRIEHSLNRFEDINDALLELYLEQYRHLFRHRLLYGKYWFAILRIKWKQRFRG